MKKLKIYPLGQRQIEVIEAIIALGKNACNFRIAEMVNMPQPNSFNLLKKLVDRCILKAEKIGSTTIYKVNYRKYNKLII